MDALEQLLEIMRQGLLALGVNPDVAEPITKPAPVIIPRPDENDPFNVPAPKVDPTPKGFLFFSSTDL